ncbi:MAG: cobalt transporter CbiM [Bryobacteraceae bacterium]
MHIPDGYLSPSTCITLCGAAAPFWFAALNRVKRTLSTRMIPLLSVFSAFSFVIMMFNLPLPGGTTGHAVGMGVASIVLGPWASIVAISVALLIQAVFFGDGGITAIGANCFNMAIVGSLVAYAVYRTLSGRAAICSTRRVVGAGIAGYVGINVAALCAAIEFGIQPVFFHDASGAPLYAPYSLSVAIPAMMIGHLTFAGIAELVISSGIVAWMQKVDPELLRLTAPNAPDVDNSIPSQGDRPVWPTARKLWLGIAILLVLTPVGILAVGSAWGEWSAHDFSNPHLRNQITAGSGHHAPPHHAPRGLERLSSVWTAPLSRYAPSFIRSTSFGYLVSAMVGVGLILILNLLLQWFLGRRRPPSTNDSSNEIRVVPGRRRRKSFVEKTTRGLLHTLEHALFAEEMAQVDGFLQRLDARVKLVGIGTLIIAAVAVHRISTLFALFIAGALLAFISRIPIRVLVTRVWIGVLAFTGAIALPAIFLTPGVTVWRVPVLEWAVSYQGVRSAAFLILRAETAATFSVLLILCTLWTHLLRAIRFFRVPAILVVIVGMTYRYIFLFLQTAQEMFGAREARLIGTLEPADRRRLAAASAGVLLGKSMHLSGEVHMAMQARGFRGDVHLLDDATMRPNDWLRLAAFFGVASAAIWLGR